MSRFSPELLSFLKLHTESVGSRTLLSLKEHYGSYDKAYKAFTIGRLTNRFTEKQRESVRLRTELTDRLIEVLTQYQVQPILFHDLAYPPLLTEIPDPPAVLYLRGKLPIHPSLAIVGSRKSTAYGQAVTRDIAGSAAELGIMVVSGLALGIDGTAHKAALEHQGLTVGVLACGIEQIYPQSHRRLAHEIIHSGGGIITEFPLFTPPYRSNFPIRNRLIAGLCQATVVTEAAGDSGSLVTAQLALEYNRDVFAVPSDIYRPTGTGPNALLRMGAIALTSGDELADYYQIEQTLTRRTTHLSDTERSIITSLPKEGMHLDKLAEVLKLDIASLSSKLVLLEIKGAVRHEGAGVYRRLV